MPDPVEIRRCRPLLGTFVEITAPAGSHAAIDAAFARIAHVQACMSFHDPASDLGRIARAGANRVVAIDPETVAVLTIALELYARSGGLFDVTAGAPLAAAGYLPKPANVDLRKARGNARWIELLDATHIRCRRRLLIDLGGIAKGHAVDLAATALMDAGVGSALVNAGGDLRVIGSVPRMVHLRAANGEIEGALSLADAALATSSNLHLRRRHRGREISPHLGRGRTPVLADKAVTVIAKRCVIADAMTKIALADPPLAAAMLGEHGGAVIDRVPSRQAA